MTTTELPSLDSKETAVAVRKALRAAFPAVRFSVVTQRGSMVSSVRVAWVDGPTIKRVDAIVDQFQAGNFNGMTDSYDYDRSRRVVVDGVEYRPGCRYVSTSRTISPALANRCIVAIAAFWGGIAYQLPTAVTSRHGGDGFEVSDGRGRACVRADVDDDWYTSIHRAAEDRTAFVREVDR